jgi:hypothetical protein
MQEKVPKRHSIKISVPYNITIPKWRTFNLLQLIQRREPLSNDGTLIYKSIQIAAYADDVNIKARTQQDLKNTYILLEQNAQKVGEQINITKTKVLTQTRANNPTVQNNNWCTKN